MIKYRSDDPDLNAWNQWAGNSVFRTYTARGFLETGNAIELNKHLASNGAAYGLWGPRGIGKSWLIQDSTRSANEEGGIGVWYPAPSLDNALEFMRELLDAFATEVSSEVDRDLAIPIPLFRWFMTTLIPTERPGLKKLFNIPVLLSGALGWLFGWRIIATILENAPEITDNAPNLKPYLAGIWDGMVLSIIFGVALGVVFGWWIDRRARAWVNDHVLEVIDRRDLRNISRGELRWSARDLKSEAARIRERIRYSATLSEESSGEVEAGRFGLLGRFGFKSGVKLDARPLSEAAVVQEFRGFASRATRHFRPVIIGIDELDKVEDSEQVRSLLRKVKGLFDINDVHFLVSISSEAARTFDIGSLSGRNEFNSSFNSAIQVRPMDDVKSVELVRARIGGEEYHRDPRQLADFFILCRRFQIAYVAGDIVEQNAIKRKIASYLFDDVDKEVLFNIVSRGGRDMMERYYWGLTNRDRFPKSTASAIGLLSGGIPREVVRMTDAILSDGIPAATIANGATATAISLVGYREANAYLQDILTDEKFMSSDKLFASDYLLADKFKPHRYCDVFRADAINWQPETHKWEQWNRLMVRLAVGARLILTDPPRGSTLAAKRLSSKGWQTYLDVLQTAEFSAMVAKSKLQNAIRDGV